MNSATVSEDFKNDLSGADLDALGDSGQGIMVDSGILWLYDEGFDPINMTGTPVLKVKTINGIVTE